MIYERAKLPRTQLVATDVIKIGARRRPRAGGSAVVLYLP